MHMIHQEPLATPLGKLVVHTQADGRLVAVDWLDNRERIQAHLDRRYGREGWRAHALHTGGSPHIEALRSYFQGACDALSALEVDLQGSPLQLQTWHALRALPAGRTETYAQLAARIGRAGSARAVGAAMGANPLLLVLPCHRVVGARGALAGYAAGIERKRWLLEHEGVLARLENGASGRAVRV